MHPPDVSDMPAACSRLILDTDLGVDIDDLGAVAVMHHLAAAGRCRILGVVTDLGQRHAAGCIDAVGAWCGRRPPIGQPDWPSTQPDSYADRVYHARSAAGDDLVDGDACERAVPLLKRLLTEAEDRSVVVATIGPLWHQADLLADQAGRDLVDAKVDRFVVMGGHTPNTPCSDTDHGVEPNFMGGQSDCTRRFLDACPRPIVFCGSEVGNRRFGYGTGAELETLPQGHPVKIGYRDFFDRPPDWAPEIRSDSIGDWSVWDLVTVLHAVGGAGLSGCREVAGMTNHADASGWNHWRPRRCGDPEHAYLEPMLPPAELARERVLPWLLGASEAG